MPKLELNVDASSLSDSACGLAFYRRVVEGYTAPVPNAAMVYGIAIHKYLETCFQTRGHFGKAMEEARKSFNIPKIHKQKQDFLSDERHMLTTAYMYWSTVIQEEKGFDVIELAGKPATEVTFRIKYYEDDWVIVYLCGTIDRIVKIRNGIYGIRDYKTSSTYQVDSYLEDYEMNAQLRFYTLAFRMMAENPETRDSVLGQIGQQPVGCFIDGIFLKSKPSENIYQSSRMFRFSDDDIKYFRKGLDQKIERLIGAVGEAQFNSYPLKEGILSGSCKKAYWNCDFWAVCAQDNPGIAATLLATKYKKRPYNPLTFNEERV